jgi:hypothetical protein
MASEGGGTVTTGGLGALGGIISTLQAWFGGHGAGSGRSASRAVQQIMLATLRQAVNAARLETDRANYFSRQAGFIPVVFGPPRLARIESRAIMNLGAAQARAAGVAPGVSPRLTRLLAGDSTKVKLNALKVSQAQKNLAKIQAKEAQLGVTTYTRAYGLNNPLVLGSRDDPSGVIRPVFRRRFFFKGRMFAWP